MRSYWDIKKEVVFDDGYFCPTHNDIQFLSFIDMFIECLKNIKAATTDKNIHALINNAMGQLDEDKS